MRLTIAYSKIKKRNLVLINNDTYQRETVSELPIRQPLRGQIQNLRFCDGRNLGNIFSCHEFPVVRLEIMNRFSE